MSNVLLLGNGINRLSNDYSWDQLVDDLIAYSRGHGAEINKRNKPFTLLYEEISNRLKHRNIKDTEILKYIAEKTNKLTGNKTHKAFQEKYNTILTTNYDYLLEKAIPNQEWLQKNTETRYSLFRVIELGNSSVWHIHGESLKPNTLCLGYDHYSGYLQNIRNYIVSSNSSKGEQKPITKRIQEDNLKIKSWVDFLFSSDIDIVGLGFDYTELDLWWILVYRARLINQKEKNITNQIRYYFRDNNLNNREKERNEILDSMKVEVVPIIAKEYQDYYRNVLEHD